MVIMPTYKISGVEIPNEELHFAYITHKLRNEYGFIESSKKNIPVNNKGEVMPMYTYPCYEWLNSIDWEGAKEWYERVKKFNVQYKSDYKEYISSIYAADVKGFDVIVIDGQVRFDCVKPAFDKLKEDGIIIFDNSDWHKETKKELDKYDLIPIHFHGFKPLHIDSETTSCYISKEFNKKAKHIIPMAGTIREQHETDKTIL